MGIESPVYCKYCTYVHVHPDKEILVNSCFVIEIREG
jgi:hypothetical protein